MSQCSSDNHHMDRVYIEELSVGFPELLEFHTIILDEKRD